jgi:thiamine-monophosphate kinase
MAEFDLIRRLRETICIQPGADVAGCIVGIGDDGAILDVPAGNSLVVCTDTLVEGVHFPASTRPSAIGHKALAVNLSDLAAMGAKPAWFFLALTLPSENRKWLDSFSRGMARLADQAQIMLAGGDVTSGPLSITVTALGLLEGKRSLLRSGATDGDLVVVSGRPGAAAHALKVMALGEVAADEDLAALEYPTPRLTLGQSLLGLASACIDISDGLAADLGHILEQSGVGADIQLENLPCPDSLRNFSEKERWSLQISGGDDYELCFTLPQALASKLPGLSLRCGIELTVIGTINQHKGLEFNTREGTQYKPETRGFQHFENIAENAS